MKVKDSMGTGAYSMNRTSLTPSYDHQISSLCFDRFVDKQTVSLAKQTLAIRRLIILELTKMYLQLDLFSDDEKREVGREFTIPLDIL